MKKLLIILFVGVLVMSLAACNRRDIIGEQDTNSDVTVFDNGKTPAPFEETAIGSKNSEQLLSEFEALQENTWPVSGTPYYKMNCGSSYRYAVSLLTGEYFSENRTPLDEKADAIWASQHEIGCSNGRYYFYAITDGYRETKNGFYSVDYMLNDLRFEAPVSEWVTNAFIYGDKIYYDEYIMSGDLDHYVALRVLDLQSQKVSNLLGVEKDLTLQGLECVYRRTVYYRRTDGSLHAFDLESGKSTRLLDGRYMEIIRFDGNQMMFCDHGQWQVYYTYDTVTGEVASFTPEIEASKAGFLKYAYTDDFSCVYGVLDHTAETFADDPLYSYYSSSIMSWTFEKGGELYRLKKDGEPELVYKGVTNGKPDYFKYGTGGSADQFGIIEILYHTYDDIEAYANSGKAIPWRYIYIDAETGKIICTDDNAF